MIIETVPLILFVVAGLFSPGPNVVMLTASGARFGFRATVPHLLGVPNWNRNFGGWKCIWAEYTFIDITGAQIAVSNSSCFLDSLASMADSSAGQSAKTKDRGAPFTFGQAILFQAVNPKLWAITLVASAGFGIGLAPHQEALRLFVVFVAINLGVCLFWTTIGHLLSNLFHSVKVWRVFMTVMAAFMASTVLLIFF